ncbi:MAG TPA: hypothetical protein ENJ16_04555 [Planctomycetaceae bacterium]|nr:hypothetical protein [Planctomycetaceae bacterium]
MDEKNQLGWLLGLAVLILGLGGCQNQRREGKLDRATLESFAALPQHAQSGNPELQAELKRIRKERATPDLLVAPDDVALLETSRRPTRASRIRYTRALLELLPPMHRKRFIGQMEREFPRACLPPRRADLAAFQERAREWQKMRSEAEAILVQPDFGLHVPVDHGLLADLSHVDLVRALARLECLHAAIAIMEGDVPRALVAWETGGRWLEALASLPHAVPRAAAARGRIEWLRCAQSLLSTPGVSPESARTVAAVLDRQLRQWPPDRRALLGDRAVGLHTYELLRAGYWMSLLTRRELEELRQQGRLKPFAIHIATQLDEDELYYLKTMRRIIDESEQPYPQREKTLDAIDAELRRLSGSTSYPWFAAEYLLPDVRHLVRWQALDRELTEALRWTIAAALGEPQAKIHSPMTGKEWHWERREQPERVELPDVLWPLDDTPVTLPVLGMRQR